MNIGVIVARFQVPELHEGHRHVLQRAIAENDRVLVVLGESAAMNTRENPLPFAVRSVMVEQYAYRTGAKIDIRVIMNHPSNKVWSEHLDAIIQCSVEEKDLVRLYGGRDSFLKVYSGVYLPTVVEEIPHVSGQQMRRGCTEPGDSIAFRRGMIHAANIRYPAVHTTVDIAIFKEDTHILLARKPGETKMRFPGGFADPASPSFEMDAMRELNEECGSNLDCGGAKRLKYAGSKIVDDYRYRSEVDKVKTMLFVGNYWFGNVKAGDDVEWADWIPLADLKPENMVDEHKELLAMALAQKQLNK